MPALLLLTHFPHPSSLNFSLVSLVFHWPFLPRVEFFNTLKGFLFLFTCNYRPTDCILHFTNSACQVPLFRLFQYSAFGLCTCTLHITCMKLCHSPRRILFRVTKLLKQERNNFILHNSKLLWDLLFRITFFFTAWELFPDPLILEASPGFVWNFIIKIIIKRPTLFKALLWRFVACLKTS